MFDRSWFYGSDGQQKGPCSDAELRDLIARRKVTADTLVWSEGMTGWAKAGDVPGLLTNAAQPAQSFAQGEAGLDPALATSGAPQRQALAAGKILELDITLGRLLRIYWLFIWRSFLGSILIGAVLGFIIGLVLGVLGAPRTLLQTTTGLAGAAVGLIWSIVCLRMALEKKYSDFRIALLPRETGRD
ncbi:GYF domain-containing protein [Bradyrhizobium viridifuturi]|uniref:GYF domain-containing protein n=1 Tax=Bradyrhizobium viridifuturi TaxID=1654716 RepID=UPI00067E81E6